METFGDYLHGNRLAYLRGPFRMDKDLEAFHIHPHYELMVILNPVHMDSIICGKHIVSDFPCASLCSPYFPHFSNPAVSENRKYLRYVFYFDASLLKSMKLPFTLNELFGNGIARMVDLTDCFGKIDRLIRAFEGVSSDTIRIYILEAILCEIYLAGVDPNRNKIIMNHMDEYILNVIEYITHHLSDKFNTQQIAEIFFVSHDKLRKDFKRCTYINIGEFIQQMRLNLARELLTDGDLSVSDVVQKCGYESESYFYKLFRSATGKTPLEYKHLISPKQEKKRQNSRSVHK